MKLTAKVIRIDSGTEFTDGARRLRIKVATGEFAANELSIVGGSDFELDDELEVTIVRRPRVTQSEESALRFLEVSHAKA